MLIAAVVFFFNRKKFFLSASSSENNKNSKKTHPPILEDSTTFQAQSHNSEFKNMSVVGIDFGTQNTVVAVARNRGIDVIINEVSNRATPSLVSFGEQQRFIGESGKIQEISNFKNTVGSLKRLAGRSFSDASINSSEKAFINSALVAGERGEVATSVMYQNEKKTFTFTQTCGMFFSKVKEFTSIEVKAPVTDVVISVPVWFTDRQRRAILEASEIAHLNCLRLINDTTASALGYGITKTDLPDASLDEKVKPLNVVFVDVGQSSYQVSVVSFIKGKLTVKGVGYDKDFGGRNFDEALTQHFIKEFDAKYKMDIKSSPKAIFRLRQGCEKVKKILSSNAITVLSVECLLDDKDVQSNVTRELFEELAKPLLNRLTAPLENALKESGLTAKDIDFVELVGGSSRVASIKEFLSKYFGPSASGESKLSTTLNLDEAVARGAALQCAIISPVFKVRDFSIQDYNNFPVQISWDPAMSPAPKIGEADKSIETFTLGNAVPSSKNLTFFRKLDDKELAANNGQLSFDIEAHYQDGAIPKGINKSITKYTIKGIKKHAQKEGEQHINPAEQAVKATLKIKARLDPNHIISIESAHQIEEVIVSVKEEQEKKEGETEQPEPIIKQKKVSRKHELNFTASHTAEAKHMVQQWQSLEGEMHASDKLVMDTAEKKNALEEFVYETRGKLEMAWSEYVADDVRSNFMKQLSETEDWLYGEGEEATKTVYLDRLNELKKIGDPIAEKYRESEERPIAERKLREYVNGVLLNIQAEDDRFDHIPKEDIEKIKTECDKKLNWLNDQIAKQNETPKHEKLHITSATIKASQETLNWIVTPILSRPKPAPKPVEEPKMDEDPKKDNMGNDIPAEAEKKPDMDVD